MTAQRHVTTTYGSPTFAAHLAAREAALGITQTTQGLHKPIPQPDSTPGDATDPDAAPPMGDMGQAGHSEAVLSPAEDARRRWGIVATSAPRRYGAYTFTSRTWEPGGRTVYVCGSPAAHVAGGYWQLDGRMSAGQGYVCARCWADVARQWGIGREWRR